MPTTLATCEVYGTIFDAFGVPAPGVHVGVMGVYKNGALIHKKTLEVVTDEDGYFTLDLPRDSVAVLYSDTIGLNISCLGTPTAIPDADSAELTGIMSDVDLWQEVPVAVPIGAGVASFNGRRGDVVLLASDVTTALGYSPADAAALANYLPLAGGTLLGPLLLSRDPQSPTEAATRAYVDAHGGGTPAGVTGDLQVNNAGAFAASLVYQGVITGSEGMAAHNAVSVRSSITSNASGSNFGASGLRIMDVDDGAGNAQWFELLPTYGAMNFRWQHTGTGQTSREFLIQNGRCHMTMYGAWRGDVDEGDAVWISTLDGGSHKNAVLIVGEHSVTSLSTESEEIPAPRAAFTPGVYIAASSATPNYQYHFDPVGLNLPGDPVAPLHAVTRQYCDANAGSGGGGSPPAGTGTELQYRASSSAFGAIAGSSVDASGVTIGTKLIVTSSGSNEPATLLLRPVTPATSGAVCVDGAPGSGLLPLAIFTVAHQAGADGNIYFGRMNAVGTQSAAKAISLWTSTDGTINTSARRVHVGPQGSVIVNPGSTAATGYALTVYGPSGGNTSFAGARIEGATDLYGNLRVRSGGFFTLDVSSGTDTVMAIAAPNDSIPPISVFYAIHSAANTGFLYFGRAGYGAQTPRAMSFYTSANGTDDYRRMFISTDGSVHINEQAIANSTYALTTRAALNGGFAKAFYCEGMADFGPSGSGFQVGSYGRVGFGCSSGESTVRVTIAVGGGVNTAMQISDMISVSGFIGIASPNLGTGGPALQLQAGVGTLDLYGQAGVQIYDGSAYKLVKFGPAGSGPGGSGRALYVD